MKIHVTYPNTIVMDLRTHSHGGSATRQPVSYSGVEVWSGVMGASVKWKVGALRLEVRMDPDPQGDWKDGEWARQRAWSCVVHEMKPDDLEWLLSAQFIAGFDKGREDAKREIRRALGLDDEWVGA